MSSPSGARGNVQLKGYFYGFRPFVADLTNNPILYTQVTDMELESLPSSLSSVRKQIDFVAIDIFTDVCMKIGNNTVWRHKLLEFLQR